jgi:hypothetical protein
LALKESQRRRRRRKKKSDSFFFFFPFSDIFLFFSFFTFTTGLAWRATCRYIAAGLYGYSCPNRVETPCNQIKRRKKEKEKKKTEKEEKKKKMKKDLNARWRYITYLEFVSRAIGQSLYLNED